MLNAAKSVQFIVTTILGKVNHLQEQFKSISRHYCLWKVLAYNHILVPIISKFWKLQCFISPRLVSDHERIRAFFEASAMRVNKWCQWVISNDAINHFSWNMTCYFINNCTPVTNLSRFESVSLVRYLTIAKMYGDGNYLLLNFNEFQWIDYKITYLRGFYFMLDKNVGILF